jgi:hypothetical protein
MPPPRTWLWPLCSLSLAGCTLSTTTVVPLPPHEIRSLERRAQGASAVVAEFRSDGRTVSGHVKTARSCRVVILQTERHERVQSRKPYRAAGALAFVGAAMTGATGTVVLSRLDTFPRGSHCDENGCDSPRGNAAVGALLLVGTSVALAATGIATFGTRETHISEELVASPPRPTRTLESSVPCGDGSVAGLGVSLWRLGERLAATSTDAQGNATLVVPAGISGALRVVADSVPPAHPLVMPGETLAWVRVDPELP